MKPPEARASELGSTYGKLVRRVPGAPAERLAFCTPALMAAPSPPLLRVSNVAMRFGGVIALVGGVCFAELGNRMPQAGGG